MLAPSVAVWRAPLPYLIVLCLCAACPGDPPDAGPTCPALVGKLHRCGLIGEGAFPCREPQGEAERCRRHCSLEASCDDLYPILCPSSADPLGVAIATHTGAGACASECQPPFTCDDGTLLDGRLRCDGLDACPDGEDEAGCEGEVVDCDDGERHPASIRCNGHEECRDGSDEDDCPSFPCDDGEDVPATARCNGPLDCEDGSDEADCASLQCGSGHAGHAGGGG